MIFHWNRRFIGKTNKMTNVKLLVKFDAAKWTFNRRDTLNNRMPYIGNYAYRAGLLTTSHSERSYWYGTIVSANTQYHPAPYINVRHALNPGTIWYWVNEDDCGPHRKAGKPDMFPMMVYCNVRLYNLAVQ